MRIDGIRRTIRLMQTFCAVAFLFAGLVISGQAQDKPNSTEGTPVAPSNELTIDSVQSQLKKLDDNKDLDPAIKSKLVEIHGKTLEHLRKSADSAARSELLSKHKREAPETLLALKRELSTPVPEQPPSIPANATLVQVQQLLSQAEMEQAETLKSLQNIQDEPKRRAGRRLEVPKSADAAKLQLQDIDKQLEAKPASDEPAELTTASRQLLEARKRALNNEITANQVELQVFEATGELLSAQRDLAARRLATADGRVKSLRIIVNEQRRLEVEKQAKDALRASAKAQPAVREIAEDNAKLTQLRQSLATTIEATTRDLEQIDGQVTALDTLFKKITTRYETAGATEAIGLLLRKQRAELPDAEKYRRKISQHAVEISHTYLDLIDYEEKRNDLATIDRRVLSVLKGLDRGITGANREILEGEVRELLETQRNVYDSLISDTNGYLEKLVELDVRERQLIAKADEFAKYCDEKILWIRSTSVLGLSELRQFPKSLAWIANPQGWMTVAGALRADIHAHPYLTAMAGLLFLILLSLQRLLRRTVTQLGVQASRSNNTSYIPTVRAFLVSGLLACLWPGLIGYIGVRLIVFEAGTEFVNAIGHGLTMTSVLFVTLELFRHICRHGGLGESHFDWDVETMRVARLTTWWYIVCEVPFALIVRITESQSSEVLKNSLGRPAFLCVLLVLMVCVHRVMRPKGGVLDKIYVASPQGWITRLQRTWHVLALLVPVALAVLTIAGYYYTALQLTSRVLATFWLVIGILIVHAALIRWSLLSYRDLAMRKSRERRVAEQAATATAASAVIPPSAAAAKSIPEVKLSDINKQTRKALQLASAIGMIAGIWLIWIDVLPALGALGQVELWKTEYPGVGGLSATTVMVPITLANLGLAIAIAALTFAASRNLPSLLQIAILQRLPLDQGVRYAITTVCRYVITIVGVISSFGAIGIGWSKVQWLVAAISVGLGFGLQEIFANFVSGLILLFERPVRPGDIVTVGDVTGHVTCIQMRATTITDWDMRELLVPNKEFITGRVMNWTLSSTVSRMSIKVGTAYGSDPDLVRDLLLKVATRNPLVLKDPPPHALFDDFDESRLNFVLRVYMPSRDVFLKLRHGLLAEIAREFQQAGIEFAFPQRDLHVRTVESPSLSFDR